MRITNFTNKHDFNVYQTSNKSKKNNNSSFMSQNIQTVDFKAAEHQGVKEMRFRGETLLTGVLLLES